MNNSTNTTNTTPTNLCAGFAMSWIGGHKGTITHTKVSKLGNGSFKFDSSHGPAPQVSLSVLIECQEFRDMLRTFRAET